MLKIAFHSNQLGIRGTEVSMYDYALYNEDILGNKSYIISDKNARDKSTLNKFSDRFEVFLYDDFLDCHEFIQKNEIEYVYFQKSGEFDSKIIPGVKNLIHAVFQRKQLHGERYAYISEWLARKMGHEDYIPYIVTMPEGLSMRSELGIHDEELVIGRHGGLHQFDINYVKEAIKQVLGIRNDITFLFLNTERFYEHPKIIYLDASYDLNYKSNFIKTCDYMIHARTQGETFGLAVAEFLFHDKPVISCLNGIDQNHTFMLKHKGIWYNDFFTIFDIFKNIKKSEHEDTFYSSIVDPFKPANVMNKFKTIFLDDTN